MIVLSMLLLALVAYYYTTRNFLPIEEAVDSFEAQRYLHLLNQPFVVVGIVHDADFGFVSNLYKQYDNASGEFWFFYIRGGPGGAELRPVPLQLENNYTPQNYSALGLQIHLYSVETVHVLNHETRNHLAALFDFTNYPNRDDLHKQHLLYGGTLRRGVRALEIYFTTNAPFRHQGRFYALVGGGFLLELPFQFMHDGHQYQVLGDKMTFHRHYSDSHRTADYAAPA